MNDPILASSAAPRHDSVFPVRLLVVEDEPKLSRLLAEGLREQGYAVDVAADGVEGLWKIQEISYGLVILDVMIPGIDGFELLRQLRSLGRGSRVILLTARDGFLRTGSGGLIWGLTTTW